MGPEIFEGGVTLATVRARNRRAAKTTAIALLAIAVALAYAAASALASAPETPEALTPCAKACVKATEATVTGILNPSKEAEPGETYEFVYRPSAINCKGAGEVATLPGNSLGAEKEEVSTRLEGLTQGTEYAVCLVAHNAAAEMSASAPIIFKTAIPPEVPISGEAREITGSTATLNGVVNPAHADSVSYQFLYRISAAECQGGEATPTETGGTRTPEPVTAAISGLLPRTQYTFCVQATNEAGEAALGSPITFTTTGAEPTIVGEVLSSLSSTSGTLTAEVDPGGLPTGYHVEFVTQAQFEASGYAEATVVPNPDASLPAATLSIRLSEELQLAPATQYRARFVATNNIASSTGAGISFTSPAAPGASSPTLPDSRAYELVSGPEHAEVYAPVTPAEDPDGSVLYTPFPFRSSNDGNAVVYAGDPPASGGNGSSGPGEGNQFLARKTSTGWEQTDLTPVGSESGTGFEAFSDDLSTGILTSHSTSQLAAQPQGPPGCNALLYSTATDETTLHALFTSTLTPESCGVPTFVGADAQARQLVFETEAPLVEGATQAPGAGHENVYDSHEGQLTLVNVLPDGSAAPNATAGGISSGEQPQPDFSNAVSRDGSRIFWSNLEETGPFAGDILLSEQGKPSVQISAGPAKFWTATPDGRYILYTEGETLWRAALGGTGHVEARTEIAGAGANVQGVIGVGEDGKSTYFVAGGLLAHNENSSKAKANVGTCQEPKEPPEGASAEEKALAEREKREEIAGRVEGRGCNLYVFRDGTGIEYIATLSPEDNRAPAELGTNGQFGDWQADIGLKTAQVTPDGQTLLFESRESLTGYNSTTPLPDKEPVIELFVFDARKGRTICASCNPTGAPPKGGGAGTALAATTNATYTRRWLSNDGTRLFFETDEALVPQDTNHTKDVYEWEQESPASPGCEPAPHPRPNHGCSYLLSGGQSRAPSYFADASATGSDVFFSTRARLVHSDGGEEAHLYDARIGGALPPVSGGCQDAECQESPAPPPTVGNPPTESFAGTGNVPSAPHAASKPPALTRVQKLKRALAACHRKRDKRRRAVCEVQARKHYGPRRRAPRHRAGGK
jgi:hypothetical protein